MKFDLKVLLATSYLSNLSAGLLGPIYAIFVESIGGDILEASGAWAVYSIVTGVLILVFGRLEDHKLSKRKMIVIGYFLATAGVGGYLLIRTPFDLFVVQAVLGASTAIVNPAYDAMYGRKVDDGRESSEWSFWEGGVNIILGISAITGGIIATYYGFHTLFTAMFAVQLLALISSLFILKRKTSLSI